MDEILKSTSLWTDLRQHRAYRFFTLLLCILCVPALFALVTQHAWEDYYITYRASKNLAEGNGLVFQSGDKLHTFTSPIGVLIPAALYWLTQSDATTLWLFRVLSSIALAGAIAFLWRSLERTLSPRLSRPIVTCLILSNSLTIDFTINGMETAFLLFFTSIVFSELLREPAPSPGLLGCGMAGMMWSRPDAFLPFLAMFLAISIFRPSPNRWRQLQQSYIRALIWATLLYGPWLLWAWIYYGSPVPHTILAKAPSSTGGFSPLLVVQGTLNALSGDSVLSWAFMPAYYFFGGWGDSLNQIARILSVASAFIWILPSIPWVSRAASLVFLLGGYYLQAIPLFPWYLPVWYLFAAIALSGAVAYLLETPAISKLMRSAVRITAAVVISLQAGTLVATAWQVRHQQRIIEHGIRRDIGEWLAANAQPNDRVFLECLGYIGFYSQLTMLDYPGLSSREVVAARRKHGENFSLLIGELEPEWLVLRPSEIFNHRLIDSGVLGRYQLVRVWNAKEEIEAIPILPGRNLLLFDAEFFLFGRL